MYVSSRLKNHILAATKTRKGVTLYDKKLIINNLYSDFKTQEINLQPQKVSKLQSKIRVEKSVIKHL